MVYYFWVFERPLGDLVEVLRLTGWPVLYGNLILSGLCPVQAIDSVLWNVMSDKATIAELILRISCKLYSGLWLKGWHKREGKKTKNMLYPKEIVSIKAVLSWFPTKCIVSYLHACQWIYKYLG